MINGVSIELIVGYIALCLLLLIGGLVTGLVWMYRKCTTPETAAERLERAAEHEGAHTDALHAAHGARLDPHPPFRPGTAPPRVLSVTPPRHTCDELGACQDRAACSACPQRTAIPTTTLHRQP